MRTITLDEYRLGDVLVTKDGHVLDRHGFDAVSALYDADPTLRLVRPETDS